MTTELLHNYQIKEIDFETILPLWQLLWPDTDDIRPMSSIKYLGGYDTDIYTKFHPTFLGLYDNKNPIGCISGHKSSHEDYRIRGIYIINSYRNKGLSKLLFNRIILQAKKENATQIWSFPKKESFFSYKKVNFIQTTDWLKTSYGLNCFAVKNQCHRIHLR